MNYNDRRFTAKWNHESAKFTAPFDRKSTSRSFNLSNWTEKLLEVHDFSWQKWQLVREELPLKEGEAVQEPGFVSADTLAELEKIIQDMPPPKRY